MSGKWHERTAVGWYDSELHGRTWEDIAYEHHLRIKELTERIKDLEYDRASAQTLPICELPKY